ncbi:MAG: conserved membrane protein of unknown function [Nitrospira sp.]|nr:MAG: conserved membrane protein of unknown function [Nitrospira sp.]
MKARTWMMQYGVAMLLSCTFALILGQVPLFRETAVGKLAASDLVQFLGYGSTIVLAWFGARQAAADPSEDWKWLAPYRALILPVTTLATVILAYGVLLLVSDPFLNKSAKRIYNWIFIVGIVAAIAWLIATWIRTCAPLVAAAAPRRLKKAI